MPIDKKKIDALMEDIEQLDKKLSTKKLKRKRVNLPSSSGALSPLKKPHLLETEKLVYFDICHYFKLTMISISRAETALEIWIKGILPLLLQRYMVEIEEWEIIILKFSNNKRRVGRNSIMKLLNKET